MKDIEECGTNEGMPMVPNMPPQPEDKGNPVSMNVSLNASGKEHVEDLISMMKNAGVGGAKKVTPDMMPMRTDMERLRDIVDGPEDMDDLKPGMQNEPCPKCGKMHIGASSCMDDIEMDDETIAEYDNEPDEDYGTIDDVIISGDDLHKKKKAYPKAQDGDNAMSLEDSIREELYKEITEKMAEGRGKKKDKKTTEGRGKVMASRGRGKSNGKLMAGRGRGKLMAGRGRGKK